jgi:hypothetical protein
VATISSMPQRLRKLRLAAAASVLLATVSGLALVACRSDSSGAAPPGTTAVPWGTLDTLVPDDAAFKFGQEVVITDAGVAPAELVALVDSELVFRNASAAPQTVVFVNGPTPDEAALPESPEIAPGAAFTFVPTRTASLTYRLAADPARRGHVQVEPRQFVGPEATGLPRSAADEPRNPAPTPNGG